MRWDELLKQVRAPRLNLKRITHVLSYPIVLVQEATLQADVLYKIRSDCLEELATVPSNRRVATNQQVASK